ncbi:hypothetical protein HZC20_02990 [Candidatus Peregrinibacteria bacterium]|nr:hypothetical protein [Candidatus Peregrinibacteria bacterium]
MDQNQNQQIDPETQKLLNTPLVSAETEDSKDSEFLALVMNLIAEGKIDLHRPYTLLNKDVYDKLPSDKQGKADLEAFNVLSSLREIKDLYDHGFTNTFQIKNLVNKIRLTKERLEADSGDIFII